MIDLKAQAEFNWQIFKGLKYNFTGAIRYVRSKQEHEIHENSNMANAYRAVAILPFEKTIPTSTRTLVIRQPNRLLFSPKGDSIILPKTYY